MTDNILEQKHFAETVLKKIEEIQDVGATNHRIFYATYQAIILLKDLVLHQYNLELQGNHPNPLNKFGKKCFSQNEEDGITLEIIRRLGIQNGFFAEFGVGNGLENNTLILAALKWRGFWVGGDDLDFSYKETKRFLYLKEWINLENISHFATIGANFFGNPDLDVISLDLDGNDIYFARNLLENNFTPKLFIVEYNAKFPPPVNFKIEYDPNHRWKSDDYFGASLSAFVEMFAEFGFKLVCCNAYSGSNAFFVRQEFMHLFTDVPLDINDIYVGPRYHIYMQYGHKASPKTVETIFNTP